MRFGSLVAALGCATAALVLSGVSAAAAVGPGTSNTACVGSAYATTFGGLCVGLLGPGAPTRPAVVHDWLLRAPVLAPPCAPHYVTEWAQGETAGKGGPDGAIGEIDGQRIPVIFSAPLMDWGWVFLETCGPPAAIRFTGITSAARQPSPCSPGTPAAECRPGLDGSGFLAAVERQVPAESIAATPASVGVVGVPVLATLVPSPAVEYAVIDVAEPDLGDGDPGEMIHVVWVVQATPQPVAWHWPDGSRSWSGDWIPQSYARAGAVTAAIAYSVTASGFWSDGVAVHRLDTVSVGTISLGARLAYPVEQVQAALG